LLLRPSRLSTADDHLDFVLLPSHYHQPAGPLCWEPGWRVQTENSSWILQQMPEATILRRTLKVPSGIRCR